MLRVPLRTVRATGDVILQSLGFPSADRATIMHVLLYAQLRGNNQNLIKLCTGGVTRHSASQRPVLADLGATFSLDAKGAFGMVAMREATHTAATNALRLGVCVGGVHGSASSTGAIGFWARELARAGLVGIICSQSPELVAPHGSAQALLGTNPIAFGFPREGLDGEKSAVVIDVATSAVALYTVVAARAAGESIPTGVAVDARGSPTTDPVQVDPPNRGALLPFGGALGSHKGSALSLAVELLGVLAGGAGVNKWTSGNWGNLVIAIDPARLMPPGSDHRTFASRVDEAVTRIENAPPSDGNSRVLLPGQRGDELEAECIRDGYVPIPESLWAALSRTAANAGGEAVEASVEQ